MRITNSMARNKRAYRPEGPRKKKARWIGRVLFTLYLILLIYLLFFADWYDHAPGMHWEYHYNLRPFLEIRRFLRASRSLGRLPVLLNLVGNVAGFIPFGFFLRVVTQRVCTFSRAVLSGFILSTIVEVIQLVTRTGIFDVDDIILNTAGTAIGYILFLLCNALRKEVQRIYER